MAQKKVTERSDEVSKIILPADMSYDTAIETLKRQRDFEEKEVKVCYRMEKFTFADSILSFLRACDAIFGWVNQERKETMFGSTPPTRIQIPTGLNQSANVPIGDISLPNISGTLNIGSDVYNEVMIMTLTGTIKRKDEKKIDDLVKLTNRYSQEGSVYKGKAFKLTLTERFITPDSIQFLDSSRGLTERAIFNESVERLIEGNILAPITKAEMCRKNGMSLRRGILLSGTYGCGKTLLSANLMSIAVAHGWTYILLGDVRQLSKALEFSKAFEPCVIFAEDCDTVLTLERSDEVNEILNSIDGIASKNRELILILTTNKPEGITKAMLRPSRIDCLLQIPLPDADCVKRLVFELMDEVDFDLMPIAEQLKGNTPSVIREVVSRAKFSSLMRSGSTVIQEEDLKDSALSMIEQVKLLEKQEKKTDDEVMLTLVKDQLDKLIGVHDQDLIEDVKDTVESVIDDKL